jgi:hypothetical protein
VDALAPFEVQVAIGRLMAIQPSLRALALLTDRDALWRVCLDEMQGRDVRVNGWDIRARWFGVVVVSIPNRGRITGSPTIGTRASHIRSIFGRYYGDPIVIHAETAQRRHRHGPVRTNRGDCDGEPVWGNHVGLLASLERCSTQAASARPARRHRGWPSAMTLAGRHMRLLCSSSMT